MKINQKTKKFNSFRSKLDRSFHSIHVTREGSEDVEATHQSVEEIISEIQNPDLDSSLEDIQVNAL